MNSKWGTYPWVIEHGENLIHPDDVEAFKQGANSSKIFECIAEGDYLTLKYNNNYYRVKDKLFKTVPTPKYNFSDIVKIKENKEAIIVDIMWHYNRHEHYYLVSVGNKKKSRRYFESEFM